MGKKSKKASFAPKNYLLGPFALNPKPNPYSNKNINPLDFQAFWPLGGGCTSWSTPGLTPPPSRLGCGSPVGSKSVALRLFFKLLRFFFKKMRTKKSWKKFPPDTFCPHRLATQDVPGLAMSRSLGDLCVHRAGVIRRVTRTLTRITQQPRSVAATARSPPAQPL